MAENPNAGHRKRLKERFDKTSLEGFHDYEAVELLLTFAIPRRDVKPLAKELVRRFGGLKGVFEATRAELSSMDGIGENAAALILLIKEAASAYLNDVGPALVSVRMPGDVVQLLDPIPQGHSGILKAVYLNTKNDVLGIEIVSEGDNEPDAGMTKAVIEAALRQNARSIILVRQTAGAALAREDGGRVVVKRLAEAAGAIDIVLHDYIVTSGNVLWSAKTEGWLS